VTSQGDVDQKRLGLPRAAACAQTKPGAGQGVSSPVQLIAHYRGLQICCSVCVVDLGIETRL
jgi:hypothetical protein